MIWKEIREVQKLLNPNDSKFSNILASMNYQCKNNFKVVFVNYPKEFTSDDKERLTQWFQVFGDKNYTFRSSETSIIGDLKNV